VKGMVVLGSGGEKLREAFPQMPTERANSMAEALHKALAQAQPGDTVLLSPACASFDLFKNYEDRGDQFRKEVKQLI